VVHALDKAFKNMNLHGHQVALISDIGCSGLFDTFFNTHALHGLHGRALTYAAGLKLSRPDLHVVVTMGDGGLGIGGAHLLAACRRNLDLTLLILNNFNFGMTGGQFSATTPPESRVGSGFLNSLEKPLDVGRVAAVAGAPFVARTSAHTKDLPSLLEQAIRFPGFSVIDIWEVCPGRYLKRNKLTPQMIDAALNDLEPLHGPVPENARSEYGVSYREQAAVQKRVEPPAKIRPRYTPPELGRQEVVILGAAGQRVLTAGEVLCIAGLTAGLHVTQKNEYNITVLRGLSISEVILSPQEIDYTGIVQPTVVIALASEGVTRRKELFGQLSPRTLVICAADVDIPSTQAQIVSVDFKNQEIRKADRALASLAILAGMNKLLSRPMLDTALEMRFKGKALSMLKGVVAGVS
jgi:pyruvate/2-oxoacid:ferredoxin oxidoreductase beta subunit/Pyruvate/2-oxoacid:ferredoxin oxidoreductase gamma subunit